MTSPYLLDSSVIIELFRNNTAVIARMSGKQVLLSSTVLGELYFGALKANNPTVQR